MKLAFRKSRKNIVFILIFLIFAVLLLLAGGNVILNKAQQNQLINYVPNNYGELVEIYGENGPDYDRAMQRYIPTRKCTDIQNILAELEKVEMFYRPLFDQRYAGLQNTTTGLAPDVRAAEANISDIIKYSDVAGTKGVENLIGLQRETRKIFEILTREDTSSSDLTRDDWFQLKIILQAFHDPKLIDSTLQECLVDDGWTFD